MNLISHRLDISLNESEENDADKITAMSKQREYNWSSLVRGNSLRRFSANENIF